MIIYLPSRYKIQFIKGKLMLPKTRLENLSCHPFPFTCQASAYKACWSKYQGLVLVIMCL